MKTLYAACLARLGLSREEAARFHDVRLDTVKSWCAGRNRVPNGAWDELRAYEAAIVDRSEAIREAWEDAGETRDINATIAEDRGLMALADFTLSAEVYPDNARVG
jgi:hypothetical protein